MTDGSTSNPTQLSPKKQLLPVYYLHQISYRTIDGLYDEVYFVGKKFDAAGSSGT